jgi:hypothetical protein
MDSLLLLVPFITSAIMFGVKALAGLYLVGNGETEKPWLRAILIGVSLLGVVATNFLNGTPVDPQQVSSLVTAFIQTGVLAYFAHAFYNSAFKQS